jgi:hypothetical protein
MSHDKQSPEWWYPKPGHHTRAIIAPLTADNMDHDTFCLQFVKLISTLIPESI